LDRWQTYWRDPYYLLLTIPWPGFLGLIALIYGLINVLFALAYQVEGGIANADPLTFADAFFFSVQTFTTIGYGALYPESLSAHILVTIEAWVGILCVALMTGLAFARFAQPTARVMFSRVAIIRPYNGVPTLMFRTANQRRNQILEAQVRVYLIRDEVSQEGEFLRRLHELKLVRDRTPAFSLSWMVMHPIDPTSPLHTMESETWAKTKSMLVVSLAGIDETVGQAIHARYTYGFDEVMWNQQFRDILQKTPGGHRYVDYSHFHQVEPMQEVMPEPQ
jgi:inward rectifier potassium channel